jgi:NTE family protein
MTSQASADDITIDAGSEWGYRRREPLQAAFAKAAKDLLDTDGWPNPANNNSRELVADLALEGGGVKGIGLVGAVLALNEAGYSFRCVAGTSAGAIAAVLIAAISKTSKDYRSLRRYMGSLQFSNFMPGGPTHEFLHHHGGKAGNLAADAAKLSHSMGLYSSDYLRTWLTPILGQLGVRTFGDLKLTATDDPGLSVPAGHDYRLVVHTADITRAQLVHLPWDYPFYGHNRDGQDVIQAVRASMSIPFFFEPVTFQSQKATAPVPTPGGGSINQTYEAGTVTWVDGGMLRNFPINAFDRADGGPPRWPTIGIKLSSLDTSFPSTNACESSLAVGVRCLRTMMNEWDAYEVDETTAARTIFVANGGLTATQFDLTQTQQDMLFLNGVRAATQFVIEKAVGGVPRNEDQASTIVRQRRQP